MRNDRYKKKRRYKEKKVKLGDEKRSSRCISTWINSESYNPWVGYKASTMAKKRKNR